MEATEIRIAALRAAVEAGALRLDAQHAAVRLLDWERLLQRLADDGEAAQDAGQNSN